LRNGGVNIAGVQQPLSRIVEKRGRLQMIGRGRNLRAGLRLLGCTLTVT
jgi:hypothetical protein